MKRRNVLKGILGVTGTTIIAGSCGYAYVKNPSGYNRENIIEFQDLLAELVDVIIPPSKTPGGKEAQAYLFITSFMKHCATDKEYRNFYNGLVDFQEFTLRNSSNEYALCTLKEQTKLLEQFIEENKSHGTISKIKEKLRGKSFVQLLRKLTVEGYCQSQIGATVHLAYQPIPGQYNAIIPLEPNQPCWATK